MSFASELSNFTVKAASNTEKVFRGSTISLFRNIIRRTPVKEGRLRGNWQTDLNQPASGELERIGEDASIREAVAVASKAKLDDSIYMVNNLPYARPIEGGSSTQSPNGMVSVSVAEFNREVEKQARKLK